MYKLPDLHHIDIMFKVSIRILLTFLERY
uniref:Uncharacterized protein n=1 Tax=Arundo donax TaxID=35708 RepID=A0A0A8Y6N1_ARUDO